MLDFVEQIALENERPTKKTALFTFEWWMYDWTLLPPAFLCAIRRHLDWIEDDEVGSSDVVVSFSFPYTPSLDSVKTGEISWRKDETRQDFEKRLSQCPAYQEVASRRDGVMAVYDEEDDPERVFGKPPTK